MARRKIVQKQNYVTSRNLKLSESSSEGAHEWQRKVSDTLRWRKNFWNGDTNWKRAYDMFRSKHWRDNDEIDPSSDFLRDRVTVNVTGSNVLNLVPFLMAVNPEFVCKARKAEEVISAQLQSAVLNYEYQKREMNVQVKKSVMDAVIIGHGVIKTGFNIELDQARSKKDGEINYAEYIVEEAPFVERVNPFLFVYDPTAKNQNLNTAQWCAQLFFAPIQDILANESYDSKVIGKIKAGYYEIGTKEGLSFGENETLFSTKDDSVDSTVGVLFELWDKKHRKYFVFAEGVPEPLIEKDWPYDYLKRFPFQKLDFIEIPDCPYGVGVPFWIEDQQFELNRIRTSMFQHRRVSNRKYEVHESVEDEEVSKLIDGEDGSIVRVRQMDSIKPIQDATQAGDVYNLEAIIKQDIQDLTGIDALIRGGQLPSRTTAGEVNARANLFRLKLDDRIEAVDRFVRNVAELVLDHIKANYVTERVIEIAGPEGKYWKDFSPEDIQADTDVTMETISAPKSDPVLDRQQRLQVLQIAMQALPLIQAQMLTMDMNQLFKWVFESFGVKDAGRFFPPMLEVNKPLVPVDTEQQPQVSTEVSEPNVTDITNQFGNQIGQQI